MSIVNRLSCALLCAAVFLACSPAPDETRLKRREILYHFSTLSDDCVAIFGAGAIRDTTPDGVIALLGEDLSSFRYLDIENGVMHISLPWPYHDIEVPVAIERDEYGYRLKSVYGKILFSFTAYQLEDNLSVLRIDGRFCHDMPQFFKEHLLATWIKNIIKTVRERRD